MAFLGNDSLCCFQTALPVANKRGSTQATVLTSNSTVPAKTEATIPVTNVTAAAFQAAKQHTTDTPIQTPAAVVLPAAPAVLSGGKAASILHPLPSVPITGTAALGAATPSLGAWSPDQEKQAKTAAAKAIAAAATTAAAAAGVARAATDNPGSHLHAVGDPSEPGIWADLAAELRSAPISLPHLAEPGRSLMPATAEAAALSASESAGTAGLTSVAASSIASRKTAQKPQVTHIHKKPVASDLHAAAGHNAKAPQEGNKQADQQQEEGTSSGSDDVVQDKPPTKAVKGSRTARSKAKVQEDAVPQPSVTSAKPVTTPKKGRKGKAKASADLSSASKAHQKQTTTAAAPTAKAPAQQAVKPPTEKGKRGNFRGTGALGLSRRLSTQILTPQEANVLARLPLPPDLHRLDQQLFPALNAMYGFLLRQHIQVCSERCILYRTMLRNVQVV